MLKVVVTPLTPLPRYFLLFLEQRMNICRGFSTQDSLYTTLPIMRTIQAWLAFIHFVLVPTVPNVDQNILFAIFETQLPHIQNKISSLLR